MKCADQFSPLIVRVSVLHAADRPDGYMEGFGENVLAFVWKHFSSIKNRTPPSFVKTLDLTSGTSMRNIVGLILVRNDLNSFNFYSIDSFHYYIHCSVFQSFFHIS